MTRAVLTLNAGSSSLKFAIFALEEAGPRPLAEGVAEAIGTAPHLTIHEQGRAAPISHDLPQGASEARILELVLRWIADHEAGLTPVAAGHRVVHGGADFAAPAIVTPEVLAALDRLSPLAPLHQPWNLAPIRALRAAVPDLPQIACFDTAFHTTNRPEVTSFALPYEMTEAGIRRYGFHGLSYEYIASCLPEHLGARAMGRVVVAHLGNGASMCGMRGGRSVASTMGFTAVEGLPMGTRCGTLDPGVLLYLMTERGMDAAGLSDLVYRKSGLLGMSGLSNDMRSLLASDAPRAKAAIAVFTHRILRELGSLAAAIGGLDALVFTGGIGAGAAPIRAAVCEAAAWLGIRLDPLRNADGGPRISTEDSPVAVLALPTDEDLMIARHCARLIATPQK